MSVTHKKSEKQIGAAELEALRTSIMAEVEAARAETEESIISSIRNNLVSLPTDCENVIFFTVCFLSRFYLQNRNIFIKI